MPLSKKEIALRAYKKSIKPPPKRPVLSAEYKVANAMRKANAVAELIASQPTESLQRMQELGIEPKYNQAGTCYARVYPVLTVDEGLCYNAITKDRHVISRHKYQVDAFIASMLALRVTKTYQANGKRQPNRSDPVEAITTKFPGMTVKTACGMLRQAYRDAIITDPANWRQLHDQLDYEIELLRRSQSHTAKHLGRT